MTGFVPEWLHLVLEGRRLDWFGLGPGSVNRTAAFIAAMLVSGVALGLLWRGKGFWAAVLWCAVWGVLLVATASRGGILGAAAGMLVLGWRVPPEWTWLRGVAVAIVLCGLLAYAIHSGTAKRFVNAARVSDGSTQVRLDLYGSGLRMLADAPRGWGTGQAAAAYHNWYQQPGNGARYLSLVNGYLTWLVERGTAARLLAAACLGVVLALLWPHRGQRLAAGALAVWATVLVAALFSNVFDYPLVWVPPLLWLVAVVGWRVTARQWPSVRVAAIAVTACFATYFTMVCGGIALGAGHPEIRGSAAEVVIGDGPTLVVFNPDMSVLGDAYGHDIRLRLDALGGGARVVSGAEVSAIGSAKTVVLGGGSIPGQPLLLPGADIILFNPAGAPELEVLAQWQVNSVHLLWGDRHNWWGRQGWHEALRDQPQFSAEVLRGVATYVPGWVDHVEQLLVAENRKDR